MWNQTRWHVVLRQRGDTGDVGIRGQKGTERDRELGLQKREREKGRKDMEIYSEMKREFLERRGQRGRNTERKRHGEKEVELKGREKDM